LTVQRSGTAADAVGHGLFYEDFMVGQRFQSGTRTITEEDLRRFTELTGDASAVHVDGDYARSIGFGAPVVHGPFGIAVVFGLLFQERIVDATAVAMLDLDWRFVAPILVGDELRFEMTVTRCRRSRRRQTGVINRHFRLLKQADVVVQEGTSAFLVQARGAVPDPDPSILTDFCSLAWAEALRPRLASNPAFREATQTFDGSIGLRCGRESVQLRIFKGEVLECSASTPNGPTFTLAGSELAWVGLTLGERNDFIARATLGELSVSGSSYQYLRMTKALVAIWDAIRALAADGVRG
jgi:acyl dehydratase